MLALEGDTVMSSIEHIYGNLQEKSAEEVQNAVNSIGFQEINYDE